MRAANFISLKNRSPSAEFEPANLGSNGKHAKYQTTEDDWKCLGSNPNMEAEISRRLFQSLHENYETLPLISVFYILNFHHLYSPFQDTKPKQPMRCHKINNQSLK
jgi:hypothetical protein